MKRKNVNDKTNINQANEKIEIKKIQKTKNENINDNNEYKLNK